MVEFDLQRAPLDGAGLRVRQFPAYAVNLVGQALAVAQEGGESHRAGGVPVIARRSFQWHGNLLSRYKGPAAGMACWSSTTPRPPVAAGRRVSHVAKFNRSQHRGQACVSEVA